MNQRGFLLAEETIKIIIALICVVFLVYLLFSLYNSRNAGQDREQALASLKLIDDGVEKKISQLEIFNPKDFFLLSWPEAGELPSKCSNLGWENCLCICKTKFYHRNNVANFAKDCEGGECIEVGEKIILPDSLGIKIENPPINLILNYSEGVRISRG